MSIYLIWFITSILSSAVHRAAGFGFGIVTLAIMQYFSTNIAETAALVSIIALPVPLYSLFSSGIKKVNWRIILPCTLGYMLTQPITNRLVLNMDIRLVQGILGALFVVVALLSFIPNDKKHVSPNGYVGLAIGCLSGVLGGLFSISGPPVAIFCLSSTDDKDEYMATVSFFFSVTAVYATLVRIFYGIVTTSYIPKSTVGLFGMVFGLYLGGLLLKRLNGDSFRKLVNSVIGITGLWYLAEALLGL